MPQAPVLSPRAPDSSEACLLNPGLSGGQNGGFGIARHEKNQLNQLIDGISWRRGWDGIPFKVYRQRKCPQTLKISQINEPQSA